MRILIVTARQRRYLHRISGDKSRIHQAVFDGFFKYLYLHFAQTITFLNRYAQLFRDFDGGFRRLQIGSSSNPD